MKRFRRCSARRFILSLLAVCVVIPIFVLSQRLINLTSEASRSSIEDLSTIKFRNDILNLKSTDQGNDIDVNEPPSLVYKDENVSASSSDKEVKSEEVKSEERRYSGGIVTLSEKIGTMYEAEENSQQDKTKSSFSSPEEKKVPNPRGDMFQQIRELRTPSGRVPVDRKVKEIKDQVIRAKAYLNFAPPNSNSHLVKELKMRIKELEHAISDSTRDSNLSKRTLQRSSLMEVTLSKANRVYPDCNAMVKKLRAMTYNAEELVRARKKETTFLVQLAGRTTPKGLHCLSMRLTAEYFALQPEKRKLPRQNDLHDANSFHFALFSDNVLACSAVVQSTIATAREPERIIFHIVTDSLNLPAISMWFLLYDPGKATIEIQSIDQFKWLSNNIDITKQKEDSPDMRYTSALNHLRFYLPDMFPKLDKILLLDHDVIVQRDLTELWNIEMMGKTNGAVQTCQVEEPSFRSMDMFINFSDPLLASKFDVEACTWAFGMNIFDLQEWRRRKLTRNYEEYLLLGKKRPLWKAGSLPLGWITFYNNTVPLDSKWHVLGLGYQSGVKQPDIDQAAVIHYDGMMKPWLDVGFEKYKPYWKRHINYSRPFLQQCNIQ
ncbi:probable galacturonosyltransferase 6 isoform X1 [Daucus carota subsp. sativus]|uniref:probable galacturonosyltransferase 6 isoform X1 n=1 Tax=Daucus carota subsp. sativus TaxID=79200 RepID=UPI0007EF4209|nr:PREDICTED: probable galacturonosyltransferase 6 isoform X1 [Daucus carota subsp. sativus]